ncbi:MAG: hypothetical protein GC178_18535 [Flavobacteriales bacterium]|nr:hypothetical protein [Flavobacteriales bacterium]
MRTLTILLLLPTILFAQSADDEAYTLGVEGIQKVDAGEYSLGIALLKKARNLKPHEYDYTFEIGKAYLKAGDAKKAEKYLHDLQYHQNVQPDLYLLLADCYSDLNDKKKNPDGDNKKELDALRYGIQKFPQAGSLYLQLGKRNVDVEKSAEALATFELGIRNAPNFAENYFWASKLMKASNDPLWAWLYAEVCFNMTDDPEISRSCAVLISESLNSITKDGWSAEPNRFDADFGQMLAKNCASEKSGTIAEQLALRKCLLANWKYQETKAAELFERMNSLEQTGRLAPFVASIYETTNKDAFLKWLANNARAYESYRAWRYWNPLKLNAPIDRLSDN